MADNPLISIIIPVKNGAFYLRKTLGSIFNQTLISKSEVIVIDSGSTDETLLILNEFSVRVISIFPADFNHGEARNLGAREAKGKYVVMTVQDAEPADENWLRNLLDGFDSEEVAGVCGQQIVPHDLEKNPIDWFRPISVPRMHKYVLLGHQSFDQLTSAEKMKMCCWDNVNAMYKRDILLKVPFRKVSFAEDAQWAKDALENRYEIVYNPKAQVKHYHFETHDFIYRRAFTVHYHFYNMFGFHPKLTANGLIRLLADSKILLLESRIKWKDKLKWLIFGYRKRQALNKATRMFLETLNKNPQALSAKHIEVCALTPQAPSPHLENGRYVE